MFIQRRSDWIDLLNRQFGMLIAGQSVNHSNAYPMFNKSGDPKLIAAVNKVMKELKADGTLKHCKVARGRP